MIPIAFIKKDTLVLNKKVTFTLSGIPTFFNVNPTFYKYDKEFAFSFGLDDGNLGAYQVLVPMFNGGTVIYLDGNTPDYPGLYYTDGAGNNIPFNATFNINMSTIESVAAPTSKMNFTMLQDAYIKNIDLTNHSYSNRTTSDGGFDPDPAIEAQQVYFQIDENYDVLKSTTGIKFHNFTSPSNDPTYDPYTIEYLNAGKLTIVNNINNNDNSYGHSGDKTAEYWINRLGIGLYRDFLIWSDHNVTRTASDFDFIDTKLISVGEEHAWFTVASHRVNHSEVTTPPTSTLRYESFKHLMEGIESRYGASGADNMWFASINTVYEYLECARKVNIKKITIGNTVELSFDFSDVSADFRNHSLSMIVDSDVDILNIAYEGFTEKSSMINYNLSGNTHALVNIGYKPAYEAALYDRLKASVAVYNLELSKSQTDLDIAQGLVDSLRNGSFRDDLQTRINNVVVIPDAQIMQIDFGRGISGYILPFPWNNFSVVDVGVVAGSRLDGLSTTTSNVTGISLEVVNPFDNYDSNFPADPGDLPFPFEACRDVYRVSSNTVATLRLTNLNESKVYDFLFYAYRGFVGNITEYTVKGTTVSLPHKVDMYDTVSINNVIPDSGGVLDISINGDGSNIGYLGILQLTEKSP